MNFTKTTFFTFCLVFLVAFCGHYKFQANNVLNQEIIIQKEVPPVEPNEVEPEYINTATIPVMGEAIIDIPIDIPDDLSAPTKENQTDRKSVV